MWDMSGEFGQINYDRFMVTPETDGYRLILGNVVKIVGILTDSLGQMQNGSRFSAIDKDNDAVPGQNCASLMRSPGWYFDCELGANLFGVNYGSKSAYYTRGIFWKSFGGTKNSLAKLELAVKDKREPNMTGETFIIQVSFDQNLDKLFLFFIPWNLIESNSFQEYQSKLVEKGRIIR